MTAAGVRVLAIAPDLPEFVRNTRSALGLAYPVYADPDMEAALAFGIAFEQTDPRYSQLLERQSGLDHHLLPVPSVFLIDGDAKIRFSHVDPVYQRRPPVALLLEAVRAFVGE